MAARRVTASTIDWAAFAKRVPEGQQAQFNAFKAKSDGFAVKLSQLPEAAPKINWSAYESRVNVPGMVESFKKQYEALTIPYPQDSYSAKISEVEKDQMAKVEQFVQERQKNIAEMKADLAKVQAMLPFEEMTMEDYFDAYPDQALDPFDRPTVWPHIQECQPEYIDELQRQGAFDEEH